MEQAAFGLIEVFEQRTLLSASPVDSESLVVQSSDGALRLDQTNGPAAATAADGSMVVTWEALDSSTNRWDIMARRFAPDGSPAGDAWRVNTETSSNQRRPTVAVADGGEFLITWQSEEQDAGGNGFWGLGAWGVFGQRYAADGTTIGTEFQVNTTEAWSQINPSATWLPDGGYAVVWSGFGGLYREWSGVFMQVYDAAGTPVSGEILVNESYFFEQKEPSVTADSNGGIVVAWSGTGAGDFNGVFARQFDANGTARGGEILVNSTADGFGEWYRIQRKPVVTADTAGGFVVAWQGFGQGDNNGIFFRHFNQDGRAIIEEVLANETTRAAQENASVIVIPTGYAVSWNGQGQGDLQGVFYREFDHDGNPLGFEKRLNSIPTGKQKNANLVRTPTG